MTESKVKLLVHGVSRNISVLCPDCGDVTWVLKCKLPTPASGVIDCFYCDAKLEWEELIPNDKGLHSYPK